ncbi:MAG TPA: HD domain-containing phosphohydrolase [Pyrinomonadaceae bacterium]|jgi:diguanylate cyclase (GGDEF)-like protein/putative nucleotidyltransferase with HDIG domain|nr:HD domain-containing phosphohydrolase [Pyrinomonadaceae bacterium]
MDDAGRQRRLTIFRLILAACGVGVISLAAARVYSRQPDMNWLVLLAFAVVSSWMPTSKIPGDKGVITASDTLIFLTLLLCGADAAILVAAAATASESARFTNRWLTFALNISLICCSLFLSTLLVGVLFGDLRLLAHHRETFFVYAVGLGVFATAQAAINHALVVALVSLKSGKLMLRTWRENYSWGFVTFFSGMLTAGVVNALIYYYGFWAVTFTVPVLLANYLAYRPYIKNIEAARRHVDETRSLHMRTLEAFATAVDAKDQITHEHVQRVQIYAEGVARLLGLADKEIEALRAGALLHDIGKIAVPDYILHKPGKLTAAEFDKMKLHTVVGAQILERIKFPYPLVPVVRHHHERWDGTGYPDGLKAEAIPLTARILTVVDCFDAVREDRQYRKGMTREEAVEFLRKDRAKHYDPQIVDLFVENLPVFEARIAQMKKGERSFAPLEIEETEAIRKALPAAGLAEEPASDKPAEYLQTILAAHQSSNEIVALYEIAQTFTSSLDVHDTLAIVVSKLEKIVPFETCVVYLTDEAGGGAAAHHVAGLNAESFRGRAIRQGEGVTGWVLANNKSFANTDPALDFSALGTEAEGYRTLAVCPLVKGDRKLGALALYSQSLARYSDDHLHMLEQVAELTADAIHKATLYAETKKHGNGLTDQLTGLPNARYFYAHFEQEQLRADDDEHPLVLITLDVDGFERVNRAVGREKGDQVLREVAALVRAQLRREDMLVRYAGDKFVALFRNTAPETLSEIAVRIQTTLSFHRSAIDGVADVPLGISIGRAQLGEDGETLEELLEEAERRLSADKAAHHSFEQFSGAQDAGQQQHRVN